MYNLKRKKNSNQIRSSSHSTTSDGTPILQQGFHRQSGRASSTSISFHFSIRAFAEATKSPWDRVPSLTVVEPPIVRDMGGTPAAGSGGDPRDPDREGHQLRTTT
uniref:Uncharacterized protein n=1 Tax=Oryza glumipatula TaxID=40148 RepID=A0A0D9ZMM9_9ORYZ